MTTTPDALNDIASRLGQHPGTDRFLVSREDMYEYLFDLGNDSNRIHVESIGTSTEGRELLLVAISSPETIDNLSSVREARSALTDASLLSDPVHGNGRLAGGKPVVLITAGIHATEVGGVQLIPELIADLATSNDERILHMLNRVVLLIVPTLNPDGMDLVHDWYTSTLGSNAEGSSPPALYHQYAGHDNNRDWYTHALSETRLTIDAVHRPWRPNVVLDLHQMGENAPRYVLPPYIDPAEPHIHPLITSLTNTVGAHIATTHHRNGHRGVASGVLFDCYSPTRAFQHYHGGVRILAEAASAGIASPATVDRANFSVRRGFDPRTAGVHNPIPWEGGLWRLRDIMDYHLTTIHALLDHVATHADDWIRDQWSMLADEVRASEPAIYAIAPLRQQIDPRAAMDLVNILRRGDVDAEIVSSGDSSVQKNSIIVRSNQPFGSYARALLDLTPYPEMPTTPYDVTSHCLPLHMGVEIEHADISSEIQTRPLSDDDLLAFPPPTARDANRTRWLAIDPRGHASIRVVTHALQNGADVRRLLRPHFDGGRLLQAGTWFIAGDHSLEGMSRAHHENVRTWLVNPVDQGTVRQRAPTIGVYVPYMDDAIDTGWLRLMLEHSGVHYSVVRDEHIRTGNIDHFDTLVFAHQSTEDLLAGNTIDSYPEQFSGAIAQSGIASLNEFLHSGGTIIAIDGAARALVGQLGIHIRFPLASLPADLYACPGSLVKVIPNQAHPLMLGIDEPFPVMLDGKNAFGPKAAQTSPSFPARFASEQTLISGWMRGAEYLENTGAIIDESAGDGRFIGFAFRPHFRTQMLASYAPLINALMLTGQETISGTNRND